MIGLGAAVDYLQAIGMDRIEAREQELLAHATAALDAVDGPAHLRPRAREGGGDLASWSRARTRTTWPRCSTWKASRCAPATIARIR